MKPDSSSVPETIPSGRLPRMSESNGVTSGYRERNSTADRALLILGMFSDARVEISGLQVAAELGVARSTAYRYIQTLESADFLEESDGRATYRLGPRVFDLARIARLGLGLPEIARPVMRELVSEVGESVLLTRLSGIHVVCLELFEGTHPARLSFERGEVLPINATASSLVNLAWLPEAQLEKVLRDSAPIRPPARTLSSDEAIKEALAEVRTQGYALTRSELDDLAVGVAAPVFNADRDVIAGVAAIGLSFRMTEERLPRITDLVREAAREISDQYIRAFS